MNETIIAVGNGGYNLAADLIAPRIIPGCPVNSVRYQREGLRKEFGQWGGVFPSRKVTRKSKIR